MPAGVARPAADRRPGSQRSTRRCLSAPSQPKSSAVIGSASRAPSAISRIALEAMSARDVRDPGWVPAPLQGLNMPRPRCAMSQSRRPRSGRRSEGGGRRGRPSDSSAPGLDRGRDRRYAADARAGRLADQALARRRPMRRKLEMAREGKADPGALACPARQTDQRSFRSIRRGFSKAADPAGDAVARMAAGSWKKYPRSVNPGGPANCRFPRPARSQGRGFLRPGLAARN